MNKVRKLEAFFCFLWRVVQGHGLAALVCNLWIFLLTRFNFTHQHFFFVLQSFVSNEIFFLNFSVRLQLDRFCAQRNKPKLCSVLLVQTIQYWRSLFCFFVSPHLHIVVQIGWWNWPHKLFAFLFIIRLCALFIFKASYKKNSLRFGVQDSSPKPYSSERLLASLLATKHRKDGKARIY